MCHVIIPIPESEFSSPLTRISCSMTPQPSSSNHSPSNWTSNSQEGWVKGKYASIHLISTASPHRCSTIFTSVCFRLNSTSFTASNVCTACASVVLSLLLSNISKGSYKKTEASIKTPLLYDQSQPIELRENLVMSTQDSISPRMPELTTISLRYQDNSILALMALHTPPPIHFNRNSPDIVRITRVVKTTWHLLIDGRRDSGTCQFHLFCKHLHIPKRHPNLS